MAETTANTYAASNSNQAATTPNAVAVVNDGTGVRQIVVLGAGDGSTNLNDGSAAHPLRTDPTGTTTQPVSAISLPLPTNAAQDGTDGTGITLPTGGNGIRGWLSGIYNILTGVIKVQGSIASGATDSGNPIKIGGKYNASAPTFTDGQRGDLQLDASGSLLVNPGHIFGEDATNDRMKMSNEVVCNNTNVFHAISFTTGQEKQSVSIDCSNYRDYFIAAWGSVGNLKILLQVSFDGGSTWLWHPDGQSVDGQFMTKAGKLYGAPLCRMDIVNDSGGTQNVEGYLCLGR